MASGCYTGLDDGRLGQDTESGGSVDGDGDGDGDSGDDGVAAQCAEQGGPSVGVSGMRLLTGYEYDNTVRELLGDDTQPSLAFPPENQTTAFENNYLDHRASKDLVRVYMDVAEDVAARAVSERLVAVLPCDPLAIGETECGHAFVERHLPRAFRRPIEPAERASFVALFDEAHAQHGFSEAVSLVIQASLQSPQFLYRVELVPDDAMPGDVLPVTGYEMASRLSYFLTASMPDPELLAAAAEGGLATRDEVEAQARRLLDSDGGRGAIREFHRQWLDLSGLTSVSKDPAMFAGLPPTVGDDWRQSVERFAEHVFFDGGGTVDDLLSSELAFLPPALSAWYEVSEVDPETGAAILTGDRAGLLTQPGLLALLAYPNQSSPVARGVFVRERMLCQHLPPPPNDIQIEPPDPDPNATTRERFAQHTEDPSCAGCHSLIDPLGFGFEHYDAIGRWRTEENGLPVDASGSLEAIEDAEQSGAYDGAVELAQRLSASTDFSDCVTHQWATFALGREPTEDDLCAMEEIRQTLADADGDLRELLVAITTSDAFRFRTVEGGGQ
ncbi:DUF1588 domain-containing protein [Paraliomyxa miuraensis]|uniref:DUF1588 domain-containing protein n=1 Tax=Paraliomyxa miuraensis TaxID=376150 RepID=UPI002253523B|nr:DUF1588 domain-containing protein [Paraliomyxa miuraensis]MCX4240226.1 DUF1588 domain-containing protein [Paraliomyxa miuraensis]